jgi:hypothetical protein
VEWVYGLKALDGLGSAIDGARDGKKAIHDVGGFWVAVALTGRDRSRVWIR